MANNAQIYPRNIWLTLGGSLNLAFAIFHLLMPIIFGWENELAGIANTVRAFQYTANLGMTLVLLVFAIASFFCQVELFTRKLGRLVLLSTSLLWLVRTFGELAYYRIGVDGAWWRVIVFFSLAALYLALLAKGKR